MRTSRSAPFLVALALASVGCRSDGGIDRADSGPDLRFAASRFAQRTREDAKATRDTVAGVPRAVETNFANSVREMTATYYLYFEDHAAKPKQASPAPGESPRTYLQQR